MMRLNILSKFMVRNINRTNLEMCTDNLILVVPDNKSRIRYISFADFLLQQTT